MVWYQFDHCWRNLRESWHTLEIRLRYLDIAFDDLQVVPLTNPVGGPVEE
jgi:hypothetical protein